MNLNPIANYFIPYRVLDIGANVGQFHKQFKNSYSYSYVFSIEASKECEYELKKITDDYLIALLAKDTSVYEFYSRKGDPTCTGNSIYRELTHFYSDDQIDIVKQEGVTLDNLFMRDSEFDLIKIDTQGSELDIISGGSKLCSKAKGILLEVSLTQYNQGAPLYDEVISFMDNFGFKMTDVLDETFNHGAHQQDILFINKELIK
jgi:FkbM family methyltransferase